MLLLLVPLLLLLLPVILMMGLFRVFNLVRAATTTTIKEECILPEYTIGNKTEKVVGGV